MLKPLRVLFISSRLLGVLDISCRIRSRGLVRVVLRTYLFRDRRRRQIALPEPRTPRLEMRIDILRLNPHLKRLQN